MITFDDIWEEIDVFVMDIALGRRSYEVTHGDVEEFDKRLNEMCEKWHNKFKDMSSLDLTFFMLEDMFEPVNKTKERSDG